MKIILNGKPYETTTTALDTLVEELGHAPRYVATAVNGDFVPIGKRTGMTLDENDRLEIVAPMKGG